MTETYFETLADGLQSIERYLNANAACEAEQSFRGAYNFGGIGYGESRRSLHPLCSVAGKTCFTTRKDGSKRYRRALAINIYRMESGRYEFNVYIS